MAEKCIGRWIELSKWWWPKTKGEKRFRLNIRWRSWATESWDDRASCPTRLENISVILATQSSLCLCFWQKRSHLWGVPDNYSTPQSSPTYLLAQGPHFTIWGTEAQSRYSVLLDESWVDILTQTGTGQQTHCPSLPQEPAVPTQLSPALFLLFFLWSADSNNPIASALLPRCLLCHRSPSIIHTQ